MGKRAPPSKKNAIKQQLMEQQQAKKHESQVEKQQKDKHAGTNPIEVQLKEMAEMIQEQNQMLEKYETSLTQLENDKSKHEVQLKQLENTLKKAIEEQGKRMAKMEKELERTSEKRVEQLVEAKMAQLVEANMAQLVEAKMAQLVEANMAQLVEAKMAQLVEAKMAQLVEAKMAQKEGRMEQLASQNVALTRLVREQAKKLAELGALKSAAKVDELEEVEPSKGCKITLIFNEENKDSTLFLERLTELERAKPFMINVIQEEDQVIDYWHHPTFQNCSRIDLYFESRMSADPMMNVFDWLHHQPNGVMDRDGSADQQQVRCMIVHGICQYQRNWIINQCSEDIQQGREPADRRPFVLSYHSWCHDQFRHENNSTGETLVLDCVMDANGQPTRQYRLRRCLAEGEEAKGAEFYTGMFDSNHGRFGYDERFNIDKNTPKVLIIG